MREQHPDFRKEELLHVMSRFKAAESVSLVGVGSVGKTNLLHHIVNPKTQQHYLGAERANQFVAIMVDPNLLGPVDDTSEQFRCWAGYELLMHRMMLSLYPFEILDNDAENFYKTYRDLQDGTNPLYAYMGMRYFEIGLEYFFRRNIQIVFLFDEFEEFLQKMPIKFFQTLRGLRDNHKDKLTYLAFSREPIPVLVEKMDLPTLEMEPFAELFTDNVFFVGPYNHDDASRMVESLIRRNPEVEYSKDAINFLLNVSGRFAGILRAGFRALDVLGTIGPADLNNMNLIERLARRTQIRTECETIWKSLTPVEQSVLLSIARRHPDEITDESERAISLLVQKHLLRVDRQAQLLKIEPPVFNVYVNSIT